MISDLEVSHRQRYAMLYEISIPFFLVVASRETNACGVRAGGKDLTIDPVPCSTSFFVALSHKNPSCSCILDLALTTNVLSYRSSTATGRSAG